MYDAERRQTTPRKAPDGRPPLPALRPLRLLVCLILTAAPVLIQAQAPTPTEPINPAAPIPAAPLPIIKQNPKSGPCRVYTKSENGGKVLTAVGASYLAAQAGFPPMEQEVQHAATGRPATA